MLLNMIEIKQSNQQKRAETSFIKYGNWLWQIYGTNTSHGLDKQN